MRRSIRVGVYGQPRGMDTLECLCDLPVCGVGSCLSDCLTARLRENEGRLGCTQFRAPGKKLPERGARHGHCRAQNKNGPDLSIQPIEFLARPTRFERVTPAFGG